MNVGEGIRMTKNSERTCAARIEGYNEFGMFTNPCGARIVEGPCRKMRGTGTPWPCGNTRARHERERSRMKDAHHYDGYECEEGHPA